VKDSMVVLMVVLMDARIALELVKMLVNWKELVVEGKEFQLLIC